MALIALACVALAVPCLFVISFEGSLEIMLPAKSQARRTVQFLRDADFADKVAVNLTLEDPELGVPDLIVLMDRWAAEFEASEWVESVVEFPDGGEAMDDLLFFLERLGELTPAAATASLSERVTPESISRRIRECYLRLVKPEGSFVQRIVRLDPLGLGSPLLARMHGLAQAFGYQATIESGHLIHADGRHGMLLLQTGVPITDTVGARNLMEFLDAATANPPPGVGVEIVSGHRHSVSNEALLKRDAGLAATVASVGFLVLFLVIFRDPRAVVIFLIPAGAVVISLNLSAWILGRLSYLVIGFGAVMAGIAVDYGIHVYVSNRHCPDVYEGVRRIVRPVLLGALTTLSVFIAFFFSAIPGYRQLAVFSVTAIVLSVGAAIFLLPPLLKTGAAPLTEGSAGLARRHWVFVPATWFFLASLVVAAFWTRRLEVETGLTQLDGTPKGILEMEERFQRLWSDRDGGQAIAVVNGGDQIQAAQRNDLLYRRVRERFPELELASLAAIWPSRPVREENIAAWRAFWTPSKIAEVRENIQRSAVEYGFAESAFEPFFRVTEQTHAGVRPEDNVILSRFRERFHQVHDGEHRYLSFFPDTPEAVEQVEAILADIPGGFVASRRALGRMLSHSVSREVMRISGIALALILAVALFLMRGLRPSLASMLPAACGVLWLFAIMAMTGLALNIANMIAGIVVIGLCIDYGIFMVHAWREGRAAMVSTRQAVTLSAVTTLIGAGVLVFARHPALFSIGLTLTIGVSAGFLASVFGVPGACRLLRIETVEALDHAA